FLPTGQVGGLAHDAGLVVDGAGRPDPDALHAVGAAEVLDDLEDGLDDGSRPSFEGRLALGVGLDLVALVDDAVDLGAAQVDADPTHGSLPPPTLPHSGRSPGLSGGAQALLDHPLGQDREVGVNAGTGRQL